MMGIMQECVQKEWSSRKARKIIKTSFNGFNWTWPRSKWKSVPHVIQVVWYSVYVPNNMTCQRNGHATPRFERVAARNVVSNTDEIRGVANQSSVWVSVSNISHTHDAGGGHTCGLPRLLAKKQRKVMVRVQRAREDLTIKTDRTSIGHHSRCIQCTKTTECRSMLSASTFFSSTHMHTDGRNDDRRRVVDAYGNDE
jgi:hypothetical protein